MNIRHLLVGRGVARRLGPIIVALLAAANAARTQESFLETRLVADGFRIPWEILWGPDDWIWSTERGGRVTRINPETGEVRELMTIPNAFTVGELGMLGMALHPDFATTPFVYITDAYMADDTILTERIVRYRYDSVLDTLVRDRVLVDSIPAGLSHGGSRIAVGPDRTLYVTIGDKSDSPFEAPDHTSILGKTLRITLDGEVPPDNPFAQYDWPQSLIWTLAHRNAQGLTFAPDGTLYATEHGPVGRDEINLLLRGRNYGWPFVQGLCDNQKDPNETKYCADSSVVEPLREFHPSVAPAGIAYYDHPLIDEWRRSLLVTTLGTVETSPDRPTLSLLHLKLGPDGKRIVATTPWLSEVNGRLRDLCIAPDGRVFIATSNQDKRYWPGYERFPSDRIIEVGPARVDGAWIASSVELTDRSLCAGEVVTIPYSASGTFRTGNRFVVELSDGNGSFADPMRIGEGTVVEGHVEQTDGSLTFTIPDSLPTGAGYRARLAATRPFVTSDVIAGRMTINPMPHPALRDSASMLMAPERFSAYQWYLDGVIIDGANEASWRPLVSGRYAVRVTDSAGCAGLSEQREFVVTSAPASERKLAGVRLFPSPAQDRLRIEIGSAYPDPVSIAVVDASGARVLETTRPGSDVGRTIDLDVGTLPAGIYVVDVRSGAGRWSGTFVKK